MAEEKRYSSQGMRIGLFQYSRWISLLIPLLDGLPISFNGISQGERLEPRQFLETLDQPWGIRHAPFGIETFGPNGIGDLYPEMPGSLGVHRPAIAGIEHERKFCGGKSRLQGEPAFSQKPIVSSEIQRDALAAVQWSFIQRCNERVIEID